MLRFCVFVFYFCFPSYHVSLFPSCIPLGYTFAIIENEFGAIPVDDQLLLGGKENRSVFIEEHLEVVNGCVWYEKKRKEEEKSDDSIHLVRLD